MAGQYQNVLDAARFSVAKDAVPYPFVAVRIEFRIQALAVVAALAAPAALAVAATPEAAAVVRADQEVQDDNPLPACSRTPRLRS